MLRLPRPGYPGNGAVEHKSIIAVAGGERRLEMLARCGQMGQAYGRKRVARGERWQQLLAQRPVAAIAKSPASCVALAQNKAGRQARRRQPLVALEQRDSLQPVATVLRRNAPTERSRSP